MCSREPVGATRWWPVGPWVRWFSTMCNIKEFVSQVAYFFLVPTRVKNTTEPWTWWSITRLQSRRFSRLLKYKISHRKTIINFYNMIYSILDCKILWLLTFTFLSIFTISAWKLTGSAECVDLYTWLAGFSNFPPECIRLGSKKLFLINSLF